MPDRVVRIFDEPDLRQVDSVDIDVGRQLVVIQVHPEEICREQQEFGVHHKERRRPQHIFSLVRDDPDQVGPDEQYKAEPRVINDAPRLSGSCERDQVSFRSNGTHHHDDIGEDVTVLVDERSDASRRHRHLLAEPDVAGILFLVFFLCNNLISF